MNKGSFELWLNSELNTVKYTLLKLYEERDRLLYIEAPRLENEYMAKVGNYEKEVIIAELKCEMAEKKLTMIQTAINRREKIDEKAIDAQLENEYQKALDEAEGKPPQSYAELSEEKEAELQVIYRLIVNQFHPETNPTMTAMQRDLFKKAQEAYRRRDLEALKLVYDMLINSAVQGAEMELVCTDSEDEECVTVNHIDFGIASMIYSCFEKTSDDAILIEETEDFRNRIINTENEIGKMNDEFPFSAAEMLADPEKTKEYLNELEYRMHKAVSEKDNFESKIRALIGSVKNG